MVSSNIEIARAAIARNASVAVGCSFASVTERIGSDVAKKVHRPANTEVRALVEPLEALFIDKF